MQERLRDNVSYIHVRRKQFDNAYMKMALAFAELSRAERKKVGCIIVSKDDQIISQGFNGTPKGFDNCCEYKDENGNLVTKKEVLHAEANAITKCAKSNNSTKDATLYVTLAPCIDCAKLIIQAEIKRVVYLNDYHAEGIELLRKANIIVEKIDIK